MGEPMAAYLVFVRQNLKDPEAMAKYRAMGKAAAAKHDMDMIAGFGPVEVLEGGPVVGACIVKFENKEAAKAFYDGDYKEVTKMRLLISDYTTFIIDGNN